MPNETRIVKLKLDIIFKRVFGNEKNDTIIKSLISALLEIPLDSISKVTIENVELPPEELDQKFSRLDLKLDVDGKVVNIEIQVNFQPDYRERTLFYWAKMFSDELKAGQSYSELPQTVCINIVNFSLFQWRKYHSHFGIYEQETREEFSNKLAIHFFELKKVGKYRTGKPMDDWIRLINAETEEELMEIQNTTNIPEVKDTIVILRQLSADENLRKVAEFREKRIHDEQSALAGARREGIQQGIKQGLQQGIQQGIQQGLQQGMQQGLQLGIQQGRTEGVFETRLSNVINIMETFNLTAQQAMDVLKVPEQERAQIEEQLARKQNK